MFNRKDTDGHSKQQDCYSNMVISDKQRNIHIVLKMHFELNVSFLFIYINIINSHRAHYRSAEKKIKIYLK